MMSPNKTYFITGLILIILPFLGFPDYIKTFLFVLLGITLIFIAIIRHMKRRVRDLGGAIKIPVETVVEEIIEVTEVEHQDNVTEMLEMTENMAE